MLDLLPNGTRVTLTTNIDIHTAGASGTVHGSWATHTGVIFDTNPNYIRYVPATYLTTQQDVEDVTRAAEAAVLHIIETAWDIDTPCSKTNCDTPAVWWAEHTECGDTFYVCEQHRASTDQKHAEHIERTGRNRARCVKCGGITTIPVQLRAL